MGGYVPGPSHVLTGTPTRFDGRTYLSLINTPSWWIVGAVTYDFVPRGNVIQG